MKEEEMIRLIECPVCKEIPRDVAVIFHCKKGHNICKACYYRLRTKLCPLGRCGYFADGDSPQRNRLAEQILERWSHECVNREHGCNFKAQMGPLRNHEANCRFKPIKCWNEGCSFAGMKTAIHHHKFKCPFKPVACKHPECPDRVKSIDLVAHEDECKFRKVPCPHGDCDETMVFHNLEWHMSKMHPTEKRASSSDDHHLIEISWVVQQPNLVLLNHSWKTLIMSNFDDKKFICRFQKTQGVFNAWVYIVAGQQKAKNYKCEISVRNVEKDFTIMTSCPVVPIDVNRREVCGEGICLTLRKKQVVTCMSKESRNSTLLICYKVIRR